MADRRGQPRPRRGRLHPESRPILSEASDVRAVLVARLAELRRAGAATAEDRKPVEIDQSVIGRLTRMDSMQDQAVAQAVEGRRRLEIRRIEATLVRIDDDEYGHCTKCGERISEGRLGVDPTVAHCIKCAQTK